ncbi:MAG: tyrosine-type recombinase/integrase [Leptospiraceae bacterium]|nr:tyrosine-type recombinase/integrase [Leptospiraceae bacterium]MDW7976817.1 tyrosine-type recombinase/integrase [Leptospiraceae bacterium]
MKKFIHIQKEFHLTNKWEVLSDQEIEILYQFYQYLVIQKNASKHTIRAYLSDTIEFLLAIQQKGISFLKVETNDIRDYFFELVGINLDKSKTAKKISSKTQRRKIASIKAFYRFLKNQNLISKNPVSLTLPKIKSQLPEALKPQELSFLFDYINQKIKTEKDPIKKTIFLRDRALIELLYSSGMRIHELLSLEVHQVIKKNNKQNNSLEVQEEILITGKRNQQRYIFVGSYAKTALSEYLQNRDILKPKTQKLFINQKGNPLTDRGVRFRFERYQKLLQTKIYPHKFRHTFATDLLNEGLDIRSLQEMLGHAKLTTTQIYTKISKAKLKEEYRKYHPWK